MENAQVGHTVVFCGLKGAAHLNGMRGHLVKFLKQEQRWAVRCYDNNQLVNAKPENLKRAISECNVKGQTLSEHIAEFERVTNKKIGPARPLPAMHTSSSHSDSDSLHEAVLDSYFKRKKGGVVVFYDKTYMLAIEFDGPSSTRGLRSEMVYVDKDRKAQDVVKKRKCVSAKELGRNFLLGETVEYIESTNENEFFYLLRKYKGRSSKKGYTDFKSGLSIYDVNI